MSIEATIAIAGAGGTIAGAVLGWLAFWLRFSDRVTTANARAESSQYAALESKKLSDESHTRITALAAEFGMYRERVALEFVSKDAMRELKRDLVDEIRLIDAKLDQVLAHR